MLKMISLAVSGYIENGKSGQMFYPLPFTVIFDYRILSNPVYFTSAAGMRIPSGV